MNTLAIIGIVIGTLVVACLFDHFVTKIFCSKPPKDSIEHFRKLAEDLEPKEFKKRRRKKG